MARRRIYDGETREERQKQARQAAMAEGGRHLDIRLDAAGVAVLSDLRAILRHTSDSATIRAALAIALESVKPRQP